MKNHILINPLLLKEQEEDQEQKTEESRLSKLKRLLHIYNQLQEHDDLDSEQQEDYEFTVIDPKTGEKDKSKTGMNVKQMTKEEQLLQNELGLRSTEIENLGNTLEAQIETEERKSKQKEEEASDEKAEEEDPDFHFGSMKNIKDVLQDVLDVAGDAKKINIFLPRESEFDEVPERDLEEVKRLMKQLNTNDKQTYKEADDWLKSKEQEGWFPVSVEIDDDDAVIKTLKALGGYFAKQFTEMGYISIVQSTLNWFKGMTQKMKLGRDIERAFEYVFIILSGAAILAPFTTGGLKGYEFAKEAFGKNGKLLAALKPDKSNWVKYVYRFVTGAPWFTGFLAGMATRGGGAGIGRWWEGRKADNEAKKQGVQRARRKAAEAAELARLSKTEKDPGRLRKILDWFKGNSDKVPPVADDAPITPLEIEDYVDEVADELAEKAAAAEKAAKEAEEKLVKELREALTGLVQLDKTSAAYQESLEKAVRQLKITQEEMFKKLRDGSFGEINDIAKKAIDGLELPNEVKSYFTGLYDNQGRKIYRFTMKQIAGSKLVERTWRETAEEFMEKFFSTLTGGKGKGKKAPFLQEQEEGENSEEIKQTSDEMINSLTKRQREMFEAFIDEEMADGIGMVMFYEFAMEKSLEENDKLRKNIAPSVDFLMAELQALTGETAGQQTSPDAPATAEPQTQTPANESKIRITKSKLIDLIFEQVREQTETVDVTKDQLVALVAQEAFKQINRKK
jgi:hypothetical protein